MCRMKALGRNYVWWPTMNKKIEQLVSSCATCARFHNQGPVTPLHPWKWPTHVYERVHTDYAEMEGQNYLVIVDTYSKWPELLHMQSTTSSATIGKLRSLFAAYGTPEELVSDNTIHLRRVFNIHEE